MGIISSTQSNQPIKTGDVLVLEKEDLIQDALSIKQEIQEKLPELTNAQLSLKQISDLRVLTYSYRNIDKKLKQVGEEAILEPTIQKFETALNTQEKQIQKNTAVANHLFKEIAKRTRVLLEEKSLGKRVNIDKNQTEKFLGQVNEFIAELKKRNQENPQLEQAVNRLTGILASY